MAVGSDPERPILDSRGGGVGRHSPGCRGRQTERSIVGNGGPQTSEAGSCPDRSCASETAGLLDATRGSVGANSAATRRGRSAQPVSTCDLPASPCVGRCPNVQTLESGRGSGGAESVAPRGSPSAQPVERVDSLPPRDTGRYPEVPVLERRGGEVGGQTAGCRGGQKDGPVNRSGGSEASESGSVGSGHRPSWASSEVLDGQGRPLGTNSLGARGGSTP